jgi:hypothetical protein
MLEDYIERGRKLPRSTTENAWNEVNQWKHEVSTFLASEYGNNDANRFKDAVEVKVVMGGVDYPTGKYIDKGIAVLEGLLRARESSAATSDSHELLVETFDRFYAAVKELEDRDRGKDDFKIEDEYDTQDLLHSFLRLHFQDIVAEDPAPSHGGKSSRIDLHLRSADIWVEVKFARPGDCAKKFTEELSEDFELYRKADIERLYCFIYDPESALKTEVREMERDLSGDKGDFQAYVYVRP